MPSPNSSPQNSTHSLSSSKTRSRSSTSHSTNSGSSYFTFPVSYAVSGLLRRLSSDQKPGGSSSPAGQQQQSHSKPGSSAMSPASSLHSSAYAPAPRRTHSPFQPPPLTPLSLTGYTSGTRDGAKLLTRAIAEEIRLLVPARLQLVERWQLVFSLEEDGVSLATLYDKCEAYRGKRGGYVLVVKDGSGGIFGAFLSDPPRPSAHFYGTGECFLWRASILPAIPDLSSLPLPPSADTTNAQRMTTLSSSDVDANGNGSTNGASTPDRIRFKAFPYSGINDYMIFCEPMYLSIGGGDGHYGLWLDDNLENGISSSCPTFGNEPLSDDGTKFDVLGVEIWYMGS